MSEVVKSYPELDTTRLAVQLPMFRSSFQYSCIEQAVTALQSSSHEVKLRSREAASTTAGAASVFMRS